MGVHVTQTIERRIQLASTDVTGAVEELTLEIALIDNIVVDQTDRPDARRCEVEGQRRSKTPCSDTEYPTTLQATLPLEPDIGQRDMACVPVELVAAEIRQGHGVSPSGAPRRPPEATSWKACASSCRRSTSSGLLPPRAATSESWSAIT